MKTSIIFFDSYHGWNPTSSRNVFLIFQFLRLDFFLFNFFHNNFWTIFRTSVVRNSKTSTFGRWKSTTFFTLEIDVLQTRSFTVMILDFYVYGLTFSEFRKLLTSWHSKERKFSSPSCGAGLTIFSNTFEWHFDYFVQLREK